MDKINEILKNDGVISFVTDTVWGVGCLPTSEKAVEKIYEIKDVFEKGLELYRAQQWKEAYAQFQLNAKKYNDYPSIIFMDRIKHFKKNPPPAEWDGVFVMKAK